MRARHRHFNPSTVDAYAAFDARYGFSQADNTDVNTWQDRTTNNKNATGTSTSRPKYRTAVMGGNPVVRFDGSNDYLKVNNMTATTVTLIAVLSSTLNTNQQVCIQWGTSATPTNNQFHLWVTSSKYSCFYRDSNNVDRGISAAENKTSSPTIVSTLFDSVQRIWENGKSGQTANTSGTLKQSASQIGIGVKLNTTGSTTSGETNWFNGDMGALTIIPKSLTNPIRKRLEHATAYSFKIACS